MKTFSSKLFFMSKKVYSNQLRRSGSFQAGDEARSAESLQNNVHKKNQSAEGATDVNLCRPYRTNGKRGTLDH